MRFNDPKIYLVKYEFYTYLEKLHQEILRAFPDRILFIEFSIGFWISYKLPE